MKIFRNNISFYNSLSVAIVLGVYIFALLFNNLHPYFHNDHAHQESCTVEAEKDPCHQKVFHHNQTAGCKHETHVYTLQNKCVLCHALLTKYYFPDDEGETLTSSDFVKSNLTFEAPFVFRFSNNSNPLRGPPASLFSIV